MTTLRQQHANKENARSSTGPRSAAGKKSSAANAPRHGLAVPIWSDHGLSAEAEALAREIAGVGASPRRLELARSIAEAQIEISRVSQAKRNLSERSLANPHYHSLKDAYKRTSDLVRLDKCLQKSMDPSQDLLWVLETPEGPEKFGLIISDLSQQLAAMARYERRALSRRKFAIHAFDEAARELVRPPWNGCQRTSHGSGEYAGRVLINLRFGGGDRPRPVWELAATAAHTPGLDLGLCSASWTNVQSTDVCCT